MDFERQLTAQLLFLITAFTAVGVSFGLWPHRHTSGILWWIAGFWLVVLGILLLALPNLGTDPLSILVRNEAIIGGTACIALGCARVLGRPASALWIGGTVLACVPFLLHWIPRLPDFAGRGGIVSVAIAAWLYWSAWLWAAHGRGRHSGAALFAAGLFTSHATFHAYRAVQLLVLTRPATTEQAGWLQSFTYAESAIYLVMLGATLWVLANLRSRP